MLEKRSREVWGWLQHIHRHRHRGRKGEICKETLSVRRILEPTKEPGNSFSAPSIPLDDLPAQQLTPAPASLKWWKFATSGRANKESFPDSVFVKGCTRNEGTRCRVSFEISTAGWTQACLNCQCDFSVNYSVAWLTGMVILGGHWFFRLIAMVCCCFGVVLSIGCLCGHSFKISVIRETRKISASCWHGPLHHLFLTGPEHAVSYTCNCAHPPRI